MNDPANHWWVMGWACCVIVNQVDFDVHPIKALMFTLIGVLAFLKS